MCYSLITSIGMWKHIDFILDLTFSHGHRTELLALMFLWFMKNYVIQCILAWILPQDDGSSLQIGGNYNNCYRLCYHPSNAYFVGIFVYKCLNCLFPVKWNTTFSYSLNRVLIRGVHLTCVLFSSNVKFANPLSNTLE